MLGSEPPTHRGRPIDVAALDAGPPPVGPGRFRFLIVPGFTPRLGWRAGLHPRAIIRLERALADLAAGLAPAVIVSGGAVHSPDNEALLMREWLLARGVEPRRIVVEPCARHSTTNLRNAGRIVLEHGASEALVVTSDAPSPRPRRPGSSHLAAIDRLLRHPASVVEQSYYLGFPWLSSFHLRCLAELGYTVGELTWLEAHHVRFRPSPAVFRPSHRERAADFLRIL